MLDLTEKTQSSLYKYVQRIKETIVKEKQEGMVTVLHQI